MRTMKETVMELQGEDALHIQHEDFPGLRLRIERSSVERGLRVSAAFGGPVVVDHEEEGYDELAATSRFVFQPPPESEPR